MPRAAFYLACGSAVSALVSIAACQILLGAALLTLILTRQRLEFPPIVWPLGVFVVLTLVALVLSEDPRAGLPQVKKLFVYLMLPVIYTAIRRVCEIRHLIWWWAAAASASALWSFVQFFLKRQKTLAQHGDFYLAYVADRVTGFMGHWMTFGAAQMAALILLVAILFHAPPTRHRRWAFAAGIVISVSIVIGWTRSVWLAAGVSLLYVVAVSRPKYLMLAPAVLLIGWVAAPRSVRERVISIYSPHGTVDSNQHRYITSRVGLEMIKAHPWFGLGPDVSEKRIRPLPSRRYRASLTCGILWPPAQCVPSVCGGTRHSSLTGVSLDDRDYDSRLVDASESSGIRAAWDLVRVHCGHLCDLDRGVFRTQPR